MPNHGRAILDYTCLSFRCRVVTKRDRTTAALFLTWENRVFLLTWPASMQIIGTRENVCIRKEFNSHRTDQDWFGTLTWPPFHCFGTPIWPAWRHVKTLYSRISSLFAARDVSPGETSETWGGRRDSCFHKLHCFDGRTFSWLSPVLENWGLAIGCSGWTKVEDVSTTPYLQIHSTSFSCPGQDLYVKQTIANSEITISTYLNILLSC